MDTAFPRDSDQVISQDFSRMRHAAAQDLRFIRETMERAAGVTAVPGAGGVSIGITAALAGWWAQPHPANQQFWIWLLEGCIALVLGAVALARKSRRIAFPLSSGAARRGLISFTAPLFAGAVLTAVLYRISAFQCMPALWLLMYGVAVIAAGTFSARIVPVMGCCFLMLGTVAALTPGRLGNVWMTAGFGGLHVAFGIVIARRHGG